MNLKEFLERNLPSDRILSYKPPSIDSILSNRGSNIRKTRGRKIIVSKKLPQPGEEVTVREGDGTEKTYKLIKFVYDQQGNPVKAWVSLPGGFDKRLVSVHIQGAKK